MRPNLALIFIILTISFIFFSPTIAHADGLIIPDPCNPGICPPPPCMQPGICPPRPVMAQLAIRYHRVIVTIEDQIAVTKIDQVFYNPNDWIVEGTYLFPLPSDAVVSNFTLWIDGKPVEGQVLDAEQARNTYEDFIRRTQDPALLEYAGRGAVQARIFPIQPQGERRIELEYTQALTTENGLIRYIYPLNTEKFSVIPLEEVSISVNIRSNLPIRAVYSPSHAVDINRESDTHVRVGYEAQNVTPDTDFALNYSLGEGEAFHILSFRDPSDPNDPDGFFLLLMAPSVKQIDVIIPKDVLLVLDRSGSMDGKKFTQAQDALRFILQHLNPADRFNIISFSNSLESYAQSLRPVSEITNALSWVDHLSAAGSTDINLALLEAAAMVPGGVTAERPTYMIFLTDGLPTEGIIDSQQILDNFNSAAQKNIRLFTFGVGYKVDTFLLDSLAQAHHGSSTYVLPEERLDETLSTFYAKISTPVLTDLTLDFGSIKIYDLYPNPLPDLFRGSQVIVVGRYHTGGTTAVTLSGLINNVQQNFTYPGQIFVQQSPVSNQHSAIPRLWATRKIGYLLNEIRLQGPNQETIDQIVRLSIRFGIVTPYTSYLITEPAPLGAIEQDRIAIDLYNQMEALPTAPTTGRTAVEKATGQGAISNADIAIAPPTEATNMVRIVGSHTYIYTNNMWVDTAFDPTTMQTIKTSFLSDDYFALTNAIPYLASAFALGPKVIAISEGAAYEVVDVNTHTAPIILPTEIIKTPQNYVSPSPIPPGSTDTSPTPVNPNTGSPTPWSCLGGLGTIMLVPFGIIFIGKKSKKIF